MAGVHHGDGMTGHIDEGAQDRGEGPVHVDVEQLSQLLEDLTGFVPLDGVGANGEVQPGHDGGRLHPPTGHVSEDEEEVGVTERDDVVPVAADVGPLSSGHVPDGGLHSGDLGRNLR